MERIPNIPSISQTIFRAALECPDVASLKQVCHAFKDFSKYLDLQLVLEAIRKLLLRLGSTPGTERITSTRNGHQMIYSATCVIKSIPQRKVRIANLYNRKVSEGIPVSDSNVFQLLSLQSLLYLNCMKTEHDATTQRSAYNSPWINARLLWILSHRPEIAKLPEWAKFWSQPAYPVENMALSNLDTGCQWCRVWNEVFCAGYNENDTRYGFKNSLQYSPLSVKADALFSQASNIKARQIFCPPIGVFSTGKHTSNLSRVTLRRQT